VIGLLEASLLCFFWLVHPSLHSLSPFSQDMVLMIVLDTKGGPRKKITDKIKGEMTGKERISCRVRLWTAASIKLPIT
jgi:hypothetical protein